MPNPNSFNITTFLKALIRPAKILLSKLIRLFQYHNYDSTNYWKQRASCAGELAVMWQNQKYNDLYRRLQSKIISKYVLCMISGQRVLDIGAGIGIVSKMICDINPNLQVDAVDFEEMMQIARSNLEYSNVNFISSAAEDFLQSNYKYNLILSSGCYSAIRNIKSLEKSLDNAVQMLDENGIILMIDPLHRWNYLARAKYNSQDVINYLSMKGLKISKKSGVLFWPFREWLAQSKMSDESLEKNFFLGEHLLRILGKHYWADYKILVFSK